MIGRCHICKECVDNLDDHYLKKHPQQTKYKILSPKYKELCKYKNCWNLWVYDGYCSKHKIKREIEFRECRGVSE